MSSLQIGRYIRQPQGYKAFTPFPFPPQEPIQLPPKIYKKHELAVRYIGKLDGITRLLPDKDFFLLMFIKKDATYSSQIEGTQATLQDAVAREMTDSTEIQNTDVDDIMHYINAVNYSLERIKEFPLSFRLIRELHEKLMRGARSTQHAYPGEFRTSQNWIGARKIEDAIFVPPPVHDMQSALTDLERFIHNDDDDYPTLIKAGLIHAQFETIHPFTDGNGRTGRMLIALYLHHTNLLELPVLYLSSYFKKYQQLYYERLNAYHAETSDIEGWMIFFLDGIIEIAESSIQTCESIIDIRERDLMKIQGLGKTTALKTLKVLQELFRQPIVGIAEVMKWTGYTMPGAYKMIDRLEKLSILEPLGDEKYNKKYVYTDYYEIFDEDFRDFRKEKREKS